MIEKNNKFWSRVEMRSENECWPWKMCCFKPQGYGCDTTTGTNKLAHRTAYELIHGKDSAKGFKIRHLCDNPPCCNPKHLIRGTQQDNMNDKMERGRGRFLKGNECSWRKLNEEDVIIIKKLLKKKIMHKVIAKKFNVHCVTVTDINIGRTWRHV